MSRERSEAFYEACGAAGVAVGSDVIAEAESAMADAHYGFIMQDNLAVASSLLVDADTRLPRNSVPNAMLVLSGLLKASGEHYRRSSQAADPAGEVWAAHMENVRAGQIKLLPREFWMPKRRSEAQVRRANDVLGAAQPGVERVLAALNYETYFKPETMAGAARTLAKSPEEVAASEELEAMPHLSVANWTIGEVAQHVYERMAEEPQGTLHVIDMCSGTGATLAAVTNRLALAQQRGHGLGENRLSMTGFEVTPAFVDQLRDDFLPEARPTWSSLGIDAVELTDLTDFEGQLAGGKADLVEADVVQAINQLDIAGLDSEDVVLATANYGFHRLPRKQKAKIMGSLGEAENAVIVVGDLRKNLSTVNRGYFNLANNGPLNAGNIGLESDLRDKGYLTWTIGRHDFEPQYVDEALRDRLGRSLSDDGFVTVAVKGPKAFALLFGV